MERREIHTDLNVARCADDKTGVDKGGAVRRISGSLREKIEFSVRFTLVDGIGGRNGQQLF